MRLIIIGGKGTISPGGRGNLQDWEMWLPSLWLPTLNQDQLTRSPTSLKKMTSIETGGKQSFIIKEA